MARARKPAPIPLSQVQAGDVFLMPLADGRFGACRVLRVAGDASQVQVAASQWIGAEAPALSEPRLRDILVKTHHNWHSELEVQWIGEPVPVTYRRLGQLPPLLDETTPANVFGSWGSLALQVFLQWRWDHKREEVLAEDEAKRQQQQAAQEDHRRSYKPLPAQTLEAFRRQTPFPGWSGYIEPHLLRASRRIIRDAVAALIELGPDAPAPAKLDVFRLGVERFNDLDGEEQFIDTIEREDICELLDNLAALVDLDDYDDNLTSYRDW
jgi:hypothetical protein